MLSKRHALKRMFRVNKIISVLVGLTTNPLLYAQLDTTLRYALASLQTIFIIFPLTIRTTSSAQSITSSLSRSLTTKIQSSRENTSHCGVSLFSFQDVFALHHSSMTVLAQRRLYMRCLGFNYTSNFSGALTTSSGRTFLKTFPCRVKCLQQILVHKGSHQP